MSQKLEICKSLNLETLPMDNIPNIRYNVITTKATEKAESTQNSKPYTCEE